MKGVHMLNECGDTEGRKNKCLSNKMAAELFSETYRCCTCTDVCKNAPNSVLSQG